jgi:hypothetical protein
MQRANQAATRPAVASAQTEALVTPLLQLLRSADDAKGCLRMPRALELYERALVLAETTMPESTLLATLILQQINIARMSLVEGGNAASTDMAGLPALHAAAWRNDERLLRQSQRCLGLLRARWAAGTLLTPTPEEAYFAECFNWTAASLGVDSFVTWAHSALFFWPHEVAFTLADGAQCVHGIHEALCAAMELRMRALACQESTLSCLNGVLKFTLDAARPWLARLRATCGLSHPDEAKLRALLQAVAQGHSARLEQTFRAFAAVGARGAADVARHGLRSCALPSCGVTEAYPKTYKLCGRCRGAAYCCAAHSQEDWKRHKREDGCAAPP